MRHAIVVDHRTDGGNDGLMVLRGVCNGGDGETGSILIFCKFIFEHVETYLQMIYIHNVEKGLAWHGCTIEGIADLRHIT